MADAGKNLLNDGSRREKLPFFYSSLRRLNRETDAGLRISRPSHFRFAARTNVIPLVIEEFSAAAGNYPIMFTRGPSGPFPVAVVGLRGANLFIDGEGRWRQDAYLPGHVRQYPFVFTDDPGNHQFVLCIDDASDMLSADGEFPLFDQEGETEFMKSRVQLCTQMMQDGVETNEFVTALVEHELLASCEVKIDTPEGHLVFGDVLTINPEKFDQLPNKAFLKWRAQGWIGPIYAHLHSSHRWDKLAALIPKK